MAGRCKKIAVVMDQAYLLLNSGPCAKVALAVTFQIKISFTNPGNSVAMNSKLDQLYAMVCSWIFPMYVNLVCYSTSCSDIQIGQHEPDIPIKFAGLQQI